MDVELAIVAGRIDVLLERARRAGSIAARRHALDALARGLLLADPGSVDEATRAAALELRVDASTVAAAAAPRQPHAVEAPLVAEGAALVRQVYVSYDPIGAASDDGLLGPGARQVCREAIVAAARRAPAAQDPATHHLVAAQPAALTGARIDGPSLGAAAFVSAVALFSGRATQPSVVVTGSIAGEAVTGVGAMAAKVEAATAHRASALVVPEADEAVARAHARLIGSPLRVIGVADVDALLRATLGPRRRRRLSPEQRMSEVNREFRAAWEGYRWPTVRASLARVSATLPPGRVDLQVEALTRLGAAERHLGDPMGSLAWLERARELSRSDAGRRGVPDAPLSYLWLQTAMTLRQLGRFTEASRAAERAAEVAERARLRREHVKALGCVGLVAMSRRRFDAATEAFDEALAIGLDFEPDRTARSHAYLIEAHGAAGREAEARAHFEAAREELERTGDEGGQAAWVRTSFAGALLALDRPEEAAAVLDCDAVHEALEGSPLPGLLARRHLGLALCASGEARRGYEILAASTVVHGRALEPHLAFRAHLNVLHEARERLEAGAWGPDIEGRARAALDRVPQHGELPKLLGKALTRARRSLSRRPSARALDELLARCERLS